MAKHFRKLRMEQMEARQMMAGDVSASVVDGNLYINEAARQVGRDNGITISQLANGMIRVEGHNPLNTTTGTPSRVNGAAYADFSLPASSLGTGRNLYVNLGGGEDQVIFQNGSGGASTFQSVVLNVGTTSATKKVSDNDRIIVNSLRTFGSLTVDTGIGNDWVFLSNATIGDGWARDVVSINTGAGADTVTMKNDTRVNGSVDIQTYAALSETDVDSVYFDTNTVVEGSINVRTGGDDDNFLVTNDSQSFIAWGGVTTNGSLTVDMGAGNDKVYARGVKVAFNFRLFTGAGADNVTIDNRSFQLLDGTYFVPRVGGDLEVQTYYAVTEADADTLRIYDAAIDGSLIARLGGGNDTFLLEDADYIRNDLDLHMGAGNDTATISGFITDHLMAWMGEGDDTLTLGRTWAYRLLMDGNLGVDRLYTTPDTYAQYYDYLGWEYINGRRPGLLGGLSGGKLDTKT